MKASTPLRFAALLDKLDQRKEAATFLPGSDSPSATTIIGAFDTFAGECERLLMKDWQKVDVARAAELAKILRTMLAHHALCCKFQVLRQKA